VAIGKPIRANGHFALLSDQGDRDALENRPSQVSCKHFVVPSTMSRHAHLARSPMGLADKVWLEAVTWAKARSIPVAPPWTMTRPGPYLTRRRFSTSSGAHQCLLPVTMIRMTGF